MTAQQDHRGSASCPSADDLFAFAVGRLPAEAREAIARHIETCAACLRDLNQLNASNDPLLAKLREPVATDLFTEGRRADSGPKGAELSPDAAGRPAVPGYEILRELGRGGMGVVYQARQVKLQRLVALKMILAGAHAGADQLHRFRTEAEAVARLQHPHIVQIFEVGEHGGLPYFSLEYVAGGSLAGKLNGTPLPPAEAVRLVETLAWAMQAAHEQGIVHRDLKPANVLLSTDGTPKVTDFGLAKKLDATGPTASGAIMGTPSYMAPEQARGKGEAVGPASDVYALGAILYECSTGRPPFQAPTPLDTVLQVLNEEPVPPRRLQPGVPRDLETICLKCLHKEAKNRYASAEALAEDLRRLRSGHPIRARPVGRLERVWKGVKRRPALALLLMVTFVAVTNSLGLTGFAELGAGIVQSAGFGVGLLILGGWLYRMLTARLREATEKLQSARQIVDDLYSQLARRWTTDERSQDHLQHAVLIKTQDLYEILADERDADGTIRRWTGLAHFHVGQVFHRALGNWAEAERSYAKAIAIQDQLCQRYPMVTVYRRDLADSLHWRATLLQEQGLRLPQAEQFDRQALELKEQVAAEHSDRPEESGLHVSRDHHFENVFAGSPVEAGLVQAFLETNGITAFLANEHVGTVAPYLAAGGAAGAVKVLVVQEKAQKARELLVDRPTQDFDYPS
jgi:hypothetical protein